MNFSVKPFRFFGFTLILLTIISATNLQGNHSDSLIRLTPARYLGQNKLKFNFIGEIIGYSYIKISLESIDDTKSNNDEIIPLKGSCYEAINGKTYKVIGTYNAKTLIWKLNCFDQGNKHTFLFTGKEDKDAKIVGKWTRKATVRNFYLKRVRN